VPFCSAFRRETRHSVRVSEIPSIRAFQAGDESAVAELCRAEGWDFWDDAERVRRACEAPGVVCLVAEASGSVLGAVQVLTDGELNWVITTMIVAPSARGCGLGTRLVQGIFDETGAKRLDVQTEDDGPAFYRRFEGREMVAFRLYPPAG
jgi:predicted N-acetyltransferase YhbS